MSSVSRLKSDAAVAFAACYIYDQAGDTWWFRPPLMMDFFQAKIIAKYYAIKLFLFFCCNHFFQQIKVSVGFMFFQLRTDEIYLAA